MKHGIALSIGLLMLTTLSACSTMTLYADGVDIGMLDELSKKMTSPFQSIEPQTIEINARKQQAYLSKLQKAGASCSSTFTEYRTVATINERKKTIKVARKSDGRLTECVILGCRKGNGFTKWKFSTNQNQILISYTSLEKIKCNRNNIAHLQRKLATANTSQLKIVVKYIETVKTL